MNTQNDPNHSNSSYVQLTIRVTKDERDMLDRLWKESPNCWSRTEYVKMALNTYSNGAIFIDAVS